MKALLVGILLVAASCFTASAAEAKDVGLAVGEKAPAFTLNDQADREVSLESLLKKGPVAVVFYRSADW